MNTVAVEIRRRESRAVRMCVGVLLLFFFPSFSPSCLAFLHSVPRLALASHDHGFAGPGCARLFLSLKGRRRHGQSETPESGCGRDEG